MIAFYFQSSVTASPCHLLCQRRLILPWAFGVICRGRCLHRPKITAINTGFLGTLRTAFPTENVFLRCDSWWSASPTTHESIRNWWIVKTLQFIYRQCRAACPQAVEKMIWFFGGSKSPPYPASVIDYRFRTIPTSSYTKFEYADWEDEWIC